MGNGERGRNAAILGMSAVLALAAVALSAGPLDALEVALPAYEIPWWTLVPLFAAAEVLVVHVQVRRESVSISFAELPLVLGLALCDPVGYVAASLVGSIIGLLRHRQYGVKLPFNLALFAFEAAVAQVLYHSLLSGGDPIGVGGFAAALAAIAATQVVNTCVVAAAIYVKAGVLDGGVLREAMTSTLAAAVANTCVGLLVVVLLVTTPAALVLLLVIMVVLVMGYRGYSSLRRGHSQLELLYRFTDRVGGVLDTEALFTAVLTEARDVLAAERAELVINPGEGLLARHLLLTDTGLRTLDDATDARPGAAPAWWAGALDGALVSRGRGHTESGTPRDGIAAPLRVDGVVLGALVVADRPHHLDTFGPADARLFASLANHASVALQNARLVDRLAAEAAAQEHRSLHDQLTGLPNRRMFLRLITDRLTQDPRAVVAMLDVDDFSSINDALGHDTGDLLLRQLGARLVDRMGEGSVARVGNDEFAVLVPGSPDGTAAVTELLAALSGPVALDGLSVDVRLTAGLAYAPVHGTVAATLLTRADMALSTARQRQQPVEAYDRSMDGTTHRLQMTGDLRAAIDSGALDVHFQPKVDPRTGRPLGAEALARWHHPVHGLVCPDVFIPLAEQTGLIGDLTDLVLGRALAACAGWRADGHDVGIAVNISARSLTDPGLGRRIGAALAAAGVPAGQVTLEVTETAVMGDLQRCLEALHELQALGVRLSVDDFGIGQSSLAYLKRLPVDELKIDKTFVMGMASDAGDAAIARAALSLGHALALKVVAEGVEDTIALRLLADWGCDAVQGFGISRPVPLPQFRTWLVGADRAAAVLA